MSARAAPSEIERLIEIGLTAYGRGDLDGALLAWEEVLGHDPTEARALGYVDYVRQNYEVISGGAPDRVPLGLTGAPDDYDVELDFGDPPGPPGRAQPVMHVIDEGWSLDDERAGVGFGRHAAPTVELVAGRARTEPSEPSFEEATKEYQPRMALGAAASEFFGANEPTAETTRGLGFVQPRRRPSNPPPQLKVSIRTPEAPAPAAASNAFAELELPGMPAATAAAAAPPGSLDLDFDPAADDLGLGPAMGEAIDDGGARDRQDGDDDDEVEARPTRDLGGIGALSLDLDDYLSPAQLASDLAAARTSAGDAASRARTSTGESTVELTPVAAALASATIDATAELSPARTRTGEQRLRLLTEVDRVAPASETPSERARRRIHALFELAKSAAVSGDNERAVVAIDAALDEDPDSAVAQKLIHSQQARIQAVYQQYLGDLNRRPRLSRAMHLLAGEVMSARAAFLLSRIDGVCSFDELLDVSGMPRFEAMRYLCRMLMRGLIDSE
ncbi:MAG: hypothetical protein KBG28_29715 [Kofleriaceae bacterium]|nr:hypothetical protein [Kofleriaceae bacterium]MBP6838038.1 hypothetical protein [Kofleriaceae bacterium]MBP9208183.1 hypothetical protein [Kofleriaceae bacterium]